jgi:hypothetical protein
VLRLVTIPISHYCEKARVDKTTAAGDDELAFERVFEHQLTG